MSGLSNMPSGLITHIPMPAINFSLKNLGFIPNHLIFISMMG
jgi:hypothetical protein